MWATDHIILPVELKEPYGQLVEPLTTLGFVAARCLKLNVGTSILVLPQRNPVLVAKQVAALDVLSNGRVILGVGVGWAEKEYQFLNADFEKRGRVMDESIRLMKSLWKDDAVEFEGEFFQVKHAVFLPKPVNRGVPFWIGGNERVSQERAAKMGDGWHPTGLTPEAISKGVETIKSMGGHVTISTRTTVDLRKKREPVVLPSGEERGVVSGTAADVKSGIEAYEKVGVEHFCASMNHPLASEIIFDLRKFGTDVIDSF